MSLHVEWMDARAMSCDLAPEGTDIGEHSVDAPLALVIGCRGDCSVVVIEGTRADLSEFAGKIAARLSTT